MKQQTYSSYNTLVSVLFRVNIRYGFLKNFVSSVLHFHFAAERLTVSPITSAQSSILKVVKSWLNLPQNCTPGTVFHPDVLNLPL